MKFRFRKSSRPLLLPASAGKQKKLRCGIAEQVFARAKCHAVAQNFEAERFGRFGEQTKAVKRPSKIMAMLKGQPKFSLSGPFGALCGALSVALLSGALVLLSLFGRYASGYNEISVPDLVSLSEQEALSSYSDILECSVEYRQNPSYPEGTVMHQSPAAGASRRLYKNGNKIKVNLTVNRTKEPFVLPELVGKNARDCQLLLQNAGINVALHKEYSPTAPAGTVIAASSAEGSRLCRGDKLLLRVSLGKEPRICTVPSLVGLSEHAALNQLRSAGLGIGQVIYSPSSLPVGTVIFQSVVEGTTLTEGEQVSLTVSGGPYYE